MAKVPRTHHDGTSAGNLRCCESDFVALMKGGTHYIVETIGLEDINVAKAGGKLARLKGRTSSPFLSFILNVIARRHAYIDHADQTGLRCGNAFFNRCLETRSFGHRPDTDGTLHARHTGDVDVGIV